MAFYPAPFGHFEWRIDERVDTRPPRLRRTAPRQRRRSR